MLKRPVYTGPSNLAPALAKAVLENAARKWVWVNERDVPFWLTEERAKAAHAAKGGQLFAPEN